MTATDDAERRLGRAVAVGLPLAGGAATVIVGWAASFGSALLVLASTALLSTISLLWASLRTLSGDAPLPAGMDAPRRRDRTAELSERKRRVLRALKDLENERALGKLDDADYTEVAARYREEAKTVMREMEAEVAPAIAEAEKVASEFLERQGKEAPRRARPVDKPKDTEAIGRVVCATCAASNEPDAAFCKGCGARLAAGGGTDVAAKA